MTLSFSTLAWLLVRLALLFLSLSLSLLAPFLYVYVIASCFRFWLVSFTNDKCPNSPSHSLSLSLSLFTSLDLESLHPCFLLSLLCHFLANEMKFYPLFFLSLSLSISLFTDSLHFVMQAQYLTLYM